MTDDNGRWPVPEGWEWTTIGAIRKDSSHSINPAKQPYQYFELYSVPSYPSARPDIVRGSEIGSNKQSIKENSVLLCKINPRINRVWVVGSYSEYPKIASTEWIAFDPVAEIYPKYLRYFMMQDAFRDHLAYNSSGVGGSLMRVRPSTIVDYPFPLAPLPAQHLIVSEIEKQFTRLDAAVAALRRARANLARYKAAVLKAAVEGRLVAQDPNDEPAAELLARILAERRAQWEAANPKKKYVEPKGVEVTGLGELPVGWVWATVEQVAEVGTGATPKRENNLYWAKGTVAWLTSSVVNSEYVAEAEEYITETALRETNAKIFPSGTLLVAMYGEGKTRGKVTEMRLDAATNQALAALTFHPPADRIRPFVKLVLMAGYEAMRRLSSGGVQPNLNLSHIKQTIVPMPPIEEQKRIAFEVDRHLSVIQATQQVITANLARAEGLRQGVLGKAFRGELVANGETAEV